MAGEDTGTLRDLSDTDLTLAIPEREIRGRTVKDTGGREIGRVEGLLIDDRNRRVRFMRVDVGSLLESGEAKVLIPIDVIVQMTDDAVFINQSREHVAGAPRYAVDRVTRRSYYNELYSYYGHPAL